MKDNEIAEIVNQLRDIAITYGGMQQLRERIGRVIVPHLQENEQLKSQVAMLRDALSPFADVVRKEYQLYADEDIAPSVESMK